MGELTFITATCHALFNGQISSSGSTGYCFPSPTVARCFQHHLLGFHAATQEMEMHESVHFIQFTLSETFADTFYQRGFCFSSLCFQPTSLLQQLISLRDNCNICGAWILLPARSKPAGGPIKHLVDSWGTCVPQLAHSFLWGDI